MEGFLVAVAGILSPETLPFLVGGVVLGVILGAIPGMTGAMGIALMLPLTYYMTVTNALTLLISIYVSAFAGGVVTAILLKIPGEPASIVTTFDGHPMAQRGEAGRALGYAVGASIFGGLFSWVILVTLTYPLSEIAVRLRPFDILSLVMMALVLIAALGQGSVIKGLIAGLLGILVSMPGVDPSTGSVRLTFGFHQLDGGFSTLSVLIGAYAVSRVLTDLVEIERRRVGSVASPREGLWIGLREWRGQAWNLLRSAAVGTWVGILPGLGGTIGSLVSYTVAKATSKTPERFGTGHADGIVACEAGNNATVGGALVPLIALGIPGSVTDVFLLAALLIHGLQPGPLLFNSHPEIAYTVFAACLLANLVLFAVMALGIRLLVRILSIPLHFLFPAILMFCVTGAFADNNRIFDVFVMLGFALVGLFLDRNGYSLGAFVIGFVLGPIAERNLRAGLTLSDGSYLELLTQPFSAICLSMSAVMLAWSLWSQNRLNRQLEAAATRGASQQGAAGAAKEES